MHANVVDAISFGGDCYLLGCYCCSDIGSFFKNCGHCRCGSTIAHGNSHVVGIAGIRAISVKLQFIAIALLQFDRRQNQPVVSIIVIVGAIACCATIVSPCAIVSVGVDNSEKVEAIFIGEILGIGESYRLAHQHLARHTRLAAEVTIVCYHLIVD